MKNVLVAGGAGYIGSHTIQLLKKSCNIYVVDDLSSGHQSAIPDIAAFYDLSILDSQKLKLIFSKHKFDAVFHFAAKLSVPESVEKPYDYFENNVVGTANLLRLCMEFGVDKFIFSSSSAVYGESTEDASETDSCNPINPYGLTKKMSEELIRQHAKLRPEFKYKILRYFNVSGAAPDKTNGPRNLMTGQLILNLCRSALGDRKIKVFGNNFETPDGTCIRDYIHVSDLAAAHICAFEGLHDSSIWNCGYGHGFSVLQVIQAFETANKLKFKIEFAPPRKGDPARLISNNKLILASSSWKPAFDNIEGICRDTFNWISK